MAERHILLTGYSQVSSETFSTVLERIEKNLANIVNKESQSECDLQKKAEYEELRKKIEDNVKEIETVDTTKEGRLLFNTVNRTWQLAVENTKFEKDYLNYAYTTAESAFKELVVPSHKRKVLNGERLEAIESYPIEAVFSFTTEKVKTNTLEYTYFHDGESIPLHIDDNEKSRPQTYQEFINSRFKLILEFATDGEKTFTFEPVEVSEKDAESNKSIDNVLEMVSKVDKYIKKYAEDDVKIHVDMSGGFRHIPLILMSVLNILQRTNHDIGEIMYTMLLPGNVKIERINDIFDMQRFTNGIHEFIKFGSGTELEEYYDLSKKKTEVEDSTEEYTKEYGKKINDFTNSVNDFSQAITLSDRNKFQDAVKEIKSAWKELETNISKLEDSKEIEKKKSEENKDTENKKKEKTPSAIENNLGLLQVFSPRIKDEYKDLWETDHALGYIDWCLDHNFIQQALTMYIEIVPEILIDHNNTKGILNFVKTSKRKIIGGIDKKVKRTHKTIVETSKVPDRLYESTKDALIKQHKAGKSEYKFLYWLLNQYTANIEDSRKSETVEKIKTDKAMCIEALKRYCTRTGKKWEQNKDIHIDKENVDVFFENIKIAYKNELQEQPVNLSFNSGNTAWELCTLDIDQFNKNWQWIINLFSDRFKVLDFCVNTIEILLQLIKVNRNKLGGNKDERVVDALKKVINDQNEYKVRGTVLTRTEVFFGYLYLKKKLKDKIKQEIVKEFNYKLEEKRQQKDSQINDKDAYAYRDTLNNIYNKIDFIELLKESLEKIKQDIEELPKDKIYTIRTEYFKDSDFGGGDDIIDIILPYTINGIGIPEYPKLVKAITSLDKYSKVDDIENLIAKNSLVINEGILEAFKQNKDEFRVNAEVILERTQSITGNDLGKAGEIADRYLRIIPESVGGKAADVDIWNRDGLTLLILRTLLYPYNTLKLIRNDSVHAREKRNIKATRKNVKLLIKDSIRAIKKYLDAVK